MAEGDLESKAKEKTILTLRSAVEGPIEELSFLRQSLLFAEFSYISYLSRGEAGQLANEMGFPSIRFYDRDGAQAYIFSNDHDAIVVCRGTEPHEWNDIQADLDAVSAAAETVGHVHRGFKREVDDLWPRLEQALLNNEQTLWFAGHSLGGAMAAICTGRCKLSHIDSNPAGLFTYGAPRVGDRRYVNYIRVNYYRWVNNNDIVTRVPPAWLGYRHAGTEVYLDHRGRIRNLSGWGRFRDRVKGFLKGLRRFRIDHFSDHNMVGYIEGIQRGIEEEESGGTRPRSAAQIRVEHASSTPDPQYIDHAKGASDPVKSPQPR